MEADARFVRPVEGFLLEHCGRFGGAAAAAAAGEYPLEYQSVHLRYAALVERLLTELLESIGLGADDFVSALRRCGGTARGTPAHRLLRSLDATRELADFLELMEEARLVGAGCFAS